MCIGSGHLQILSPSSEPGTWVIHNWLGINSAPNAPSDQPIYDSIRPGNVVAFHNETGIIHYAICIGNNGNEIILLHRFPSKGKDLPLNDQEGGLRVDTLSDLVHVNPGADISIFRCDPDANEELCRAAALHKALTFASPNGYRLLDKNCEDFVFYCCSPASQVVLPIQVLDYGYSFLRYLSIGLILVAGFKLGIGIWETICLATFTHVISNFGRLTVFDFLFMISLNVQHYFAKRCLKFHISADTIYKLNEEFKIGKDIHDTVIEFKKAQLKKFYFLCQYRYRIDGQKLNDAIFDVADMYFGLWGWHMKILDSIAQSQQGYRQILEYANLYFIDIKAYSLAFSKNFSDASSALIIDACARLVAMLLKICMDASIRLTNDDAIFMMNICRNLEIIVQKCPDIIGDYASSQYYGKGEFEELNTGLLEILSKLNGDS